jgi:raffinose/stachyose/melibiose transport system permease protein
VSLLVTIRPGRPDGKGARRSRRAPRGGAGFGGAGRALPFMAVGLLLYAIFVVYPVIQAVILAFYRWSGVGPKQFVGWSNYSALFTTDPVFSTALRNTLIWTGLALVVPNVLALALAVVLNGHIRGRIALRAAFYAPAVLATVVVAMTWDQVYDPTAGLLNNVLTDVGLRGLVEPWLGNSTFAIFAVFVASAWQSTGISMVLFLAGLQSVSPELIQAAQVDGASRFGVFRHVELPGLRPITAIILVLSVINSLKAFDLIYVMTNGGPGDSSQVMATYAWTQALVDRNIGLGSALASLLLIMALAAMVPYVRWITRAAGGTA